MKFFPLRTIALPLLILTSALTACVRSPGDAVVPIAVAAEAAAPVPSHGLPLAVVHKSPSCGWTI